jgi:hypothetical protein
MKVRVAEGRITKGGCDWCVKERGLRGEEEWFYEFGSVGREVKQ